MKKPKYSKKMYHSMKIQKQNKSFYLCDASGGPGHLVPGGSLYLHI